VSRSSLSSAFSTGVAVYVYFLAVTPALIVYLLVRGTYPSVAILVPVATMWAALPLAVLHACIFRSYWRPTWFRSCILGALFGIFSAIATFLMGIEMHGGHPHEHLSWLDLNTPLQMGCLAGLLFGAVLFVVARSRASRRHGSALQEG